MTTRQHVSLRQWHLWRRLDPLGRIDPAAGPGLGGGPLHRHQGGLAVSAEPFSATHGQQITGWYRRYRQDDRSGLESKPSVRERRGGCAHVRLRPGAGRCRSRMEFVGTIACPTYGPLSCATRVARLRTDLRPFETSRIRVAAAAVCSDRDCRSAAGRCRVSTCFGRRPLAPG